jgi:hypothetical protein
MTLTKADLVQKVADDCGFMKGEATEIVEKLLDITSSYAGSSFPVLMSGRGLAGTSRSFNPYFPLARDTLNKNGETVVFTMSTQKRKA